MDPNNPAKSPQESTVKPTISPPNNIPQASYPIHKSKKLAIIIVVISLFVILGGVLLAFLLGNPTNPKNQIPTPTPQMSTIPTKDVISTITPTPVIEEIHLEIPNNQRKIVAKFGWEIEYIYQDSLIPDCFDCPKSGKIIITSNGSANTIIFSCGGVAGECVTQANYQDMNIDVKSMNSEVIKLTITQRK